MSTKVVYPVSARRVTAYYDKGAFGNSTASVHPTFIEWVIEWPLLALVAVSTATAT